MKYYVDWSDESYPQVRKWTDSDWPAPEKGVTLGEAREEIRIRAQDEISHWRAVLRLVRQLHVSGIE